VEEIRNWLISGENSRFFKGGRNKIEDFCYISSNIINNLEDEFNFKGGKNKDCSDSTKVEEIRKRWKE
jgi:hypothetical protein